MSSDWESAVVVRVPALEPILRDLRERFDLPRKPNGIPAHVTLIVPFLPAAQLDTSTLDALATICSGVAAFEVRFARTAQFPTVLYLDPEPAETFVQLSTALLERWPALRPYAGAHRAIIPHLTITTSRSRRLLNKVAAAAEPLLPVAATVDAAQLYRFDGVRWRQDTVIPLAAAS